MGSKFGFAMVAPLLLFSLSVSRAEAQYVGAKKCQACHLQQFRSWQETKMAKSFELLKPGVAAEQKRAKKLDPDKDYTKEAECLACHTTGHGKRGGFVSLEKTPQLAGVQCETCHGPGETYLKPELMSLKNKEYKRAALLAAGLTPLNASTCKACHNPKSPFYKPFDYETRKKQGTHQHLPLKYAHE